MGHTLVQYNQFIALKSAQKTRKKKGDQVTRKGASSAAYKEESRPMLKGLFSRVENSHMCEK